MICVVRLVCVLFVFCVVRFCSIDVYVQVFGDMLYLLRCFVVGCWFIVVCFNWFCVLCVFVEIAC